MKRIVGALAVAAGIGAAMAASVVTVDTNAVTLDTVSVGEPVESTKVSIDTSSCDFYEALLDVPFAPHSPGAIIIFM